MLCEAGQQIEQDSCGVAIGSGLASSWWCCGAEGSGLGLVKVKGDGGAGESTVMFVATRKTQTRWFDVPAIFGTTLPPPP